MTDTKYNGWTNYATWRVNLEIFDNWLLGSFWGYEDIDPKTMTYKEISELAEAVKDYAEEMIIEQSDTDSFAQSYALDFLNEVNWYEIAESMVKAQIAENDYQGVNYENN